MGDEPDSGYQRLEDQIRWYDRRSLRAQAWFKWIKVLEMLLGALVPATALWNGVVTAIIGASVVLLEGLQLLNQWQHNWITYRSTCEALRHEKYVFLGRAGSYDNLSDKEAIKLLVERVEALISTEHAKWTMRQEYSADKSLAARNRK